MTPSPRFAPPSVVPLSDDDARHVFEPEDIAAIDAALLARRPLLVCGEPGTGKSQLAQAAAAHLGWPLVEKAVDARTEPRDLFYEVDLVARLGDAQVLSSFEPDEAKQVRARLGDATMNAYLRPGVLWWAYAWNEARGLRLASKKGEHNAPEAGVVVLVDEIDKAESVLPNGLLQAFGEWKFERPDGSGHVELDPNQPILVVVTTNEERDLPDAFLRRCLVHRLEFPEKKNDFVEAFRRRGAENFTLDKDVLIAAAQDLFADHEGARLAGRRRPGLAEYFDMLRILEQIVADGGDPLERLRAIRGYVFGKFDALDRRGSSREDAGHGDDGAGRE